MSTSGELSPKSQCVELTGSKAVTWKAAGWPEARGPWGPTKAAPEEAGKTFWRMVGPPQAGAGGCEELEQKGRQVEEVLGGWAAPHRQWPCSERDARSWPVEKQKALQASGTSGPS